MTLPTFLETLTLLTLVAKPAGCTLPQAPVINIKPATQNIKYDFKKTDRELTALKSNTINPYGIGTDIVTRGLRHDSPKMDYTIEFGHKVLPEYQSFCMWYKQINVNINLSPKIYIAKGYNKGKCGKFILDHEKKHVLVDRQVMNKYSKMIGRSIQNSVNMAGAQGPYQLARAPEIQETMQSYIKSAIDSVMLLMKNEMNTRQQAIDSKEEYDAGALACADLNKEISKQQKKDGQHRH